MRVVSVAYVGFTAHNEPAVAGSDAADVRLWAIDDLAIPALGSDDGVPLAFDHARIIRDGIERSRAKLEYTTLATAFLDEPFTLGELRRVYEAVWGEALHEGNFRRKVLSTPGFVEPTGGTAPTDGRPAALYRRGTRDPAASADPPTVTQHVTGRLSRLVRPADGRAPRDRGRRRPDVGALDRARSRAVERRARQGGGRRTRVSRRAVAAIRPRRPRRALGSAVTITDAQLIAEIASGYDVVVMGADKWAQVRDPRGTAATRARDAALASLPRVLVAPRPGFDVVGAEVLDIDPEHAHVSSTRARSGEHHLVGADARRRVLVDGNNVVGSRPDGWWRDRPGAARRLVAELQAFAARDRRRGHGRVRRPPRPPTCPRACTTACGSRTRTRRAATPATTASSRRWTGDDDPAVAHRVTSDRGLAQRVRDLGARVEGASDLTRELESERR